MIRLLGPCYKTGHIDHLATKCTCRDVSYQACPPSSRLTYSSFCPTHMHQLTDKARTTLAPPSNLPYACTSMVWWQPKSNLTTLLRCSMLYFQQVQALLTLFTKSLFTFPSGYVFALDIGLICSCRWRLPPNLCSRPEKRDSCSACRARGDANDKWDSHPH